MNYRFSILKNIVIVFVTVPVSRIFLSAVLSLISRHQKALSNNREANHKTGLTQEQEVTTK
jgi:hypothetical protein